MIDLYLYNNGGLADLMLSRLLYRKILERGDVSLQIGLCAQDQGLFQDLETLGVQLHLSPYPRLDQGASIDLAYLCPRDALPLSVNLADYEDTHAFQFEFQLEVFRRRMEENNLPLEIPFDENKIPLLDFGAVVPSQRLKELCASGEPGVYLELRRSRDWRCRFYFDLERLAQIFPEIHFYCTQAPRLHFENLIDVSDLGPLQLSKLSDRCDLLLGRTFDPFVLSMTEANRFKPKALCGYDARSIPRFYEYPGNPCEFLGNMDELVDFLQSAFPVFSEGSELNSR